MSRHNEIQNAYRSLGKDATFYDGMITCSTLPGRVVCGLVWNMGKGKNTRYLEKALSGIPDGFSGKLLEVPVGTGVLTMPVYKTLLQAEVTCLDYSPDMIAAAQRRAKAAGLTNIRFQQGDVGALPFEDGSFDLVLSLNGFHAFPDKEAAYREIYRVLRPGRYRSKSRIEIEGIIMAALQKNTVQHTLCMPLCGRMIAARKYPDLFPDRDAERIVRELGEDISGKALYRLQYMLMNCLIRQYNLAWEITEYLKGGYRKTFVTRLFNWTMRTFHMSFMLHAEFAK